MTAPLLSEDEIASVMSKVALKRPLTLAQTKRLLDHISHLEELLQRKARATTPEAHPV